MEPMRAMTPMRTAAFAATAAGAVLMAAGAVQAWATVRIGGGSGLPPIDTKGTDVAEGIVVLVAAVVILAAFLLVTALRGPGRRALARLVIVLAVVAAGLIAYDLVRLDERLGPGAIRDQAERIARETDLPSDELERRLGELTEVRRRPGILLSLAGAAAAATGGALTLLWIKREGDRVG